MLYTSVRTIEGNTARIEIPVAGEWRPNAYVTATLIRSAGGLDVEEVARAFGAVPIRVDRGRESTIGGGGDASDDSQ